MHRGLNSNHARDRYRAAMGRELSRRGVLKGALAASAAAGIGPRFARGCERPGRHRGVLLVAHPPPDGSIKTRR